MGQVIKAYMGIFFLLLEALLGMGIVAAGVQTSAARNYHSDIMEEIACSNFNEGVIQACIKQAEKEGYRVEIEPTVYDETSNIQLASVILYYDYAIPILNLFSEHEIRGMAG